MKTHTKIVTVGTFDLFHLGHMRFLDRCLRYCDMLDVYVNTDDFVERYKGVRPVQTQEMRVQTINNWGSGKPVYARLSDDDGHDLKSLLVEKVTWNLSNRIIAIGTDWHESDYLHQIGLTESFLVEHDISLLYVPYTPGVSTTTLKHRVRLSGGQ